VVIKNKEKEVIKLNTLKTMETAIEKEMNKVSIITINIIKINKFLIVLIQYRADFAIIKKGMIEIKMSTRGIISVNTSDKMEITIAKYNLVRGSRLCMKVSFLLNLKTSRIEIELVDIFFPIEIVLTRYKIQ
jgi:hypothetical protein